jgi:nucleoside-diphosphate-sugar epimerase
MKVSIIGGSGFLGTRLVKRLLDSGYEVVIADKRPSKDYLNLWQRIDVRNNVNEIKEYDASITDEIMAPGAETEARNSQPMHKLLEVLKGSDVVVNLAAEHRDDVTPKSLYDDVNVGGSEHVCEACKELGIKKIIFTSSVAVYGFAPVGTDETGKINYFNDYGRTKYEAEEKYREWLKDDNQNSLTIIRPTVIFGEKNRGNVYNLLHQIAKGFFPMVGNGKNRKSMNYVENVAAFIEYELTHNTEPGEHLFNYCDEPAYDMNHLVLDIHKFLGTPKKRLFHWSYHLAYFGGLCFDLLASITHKKFPINSIRVKKFTENTYFVGNNIKKLTDFKAPVVLADGLKRTIEYEFIHHYDVKEK